MSEERTVINQLLQGLHDLVSDPDRETLYERLDRMVSELPRELDSSDSEDSAEELDIKHRLANVENTLMQFPERMQELMAEFVPIGDGHTEPYEFEYGVLQGGAVEERVDHIDIKPSDIDGNLNAGLGQIAIGVTGDGELKYISLAASAVVKYLRLERPVATASTSTTVYGQMIGPVQQNDFFVAQIDREDSGGGGEYDQWKEMEVDTTSGIFKDASKRTHTSTSASLFEVNLVTEIPTGTLVLVHIEHGDNDLYSFNYHSADKDKVANNAVNAPLKYEGWFDIVGNVASYGLDTVNDWSGRCIRVHAAVATGSGIADETDPIWSHTAVYYKDHYHNAWTAAGVNDYHAEFTNLDVAQQEIVKLDVVGDETGLTAIITMETDGTLDLNVTNYGAAPYHMRVFIIAGEKQTSADYIDIPPP